MPGVPLAGLGLFALGRLRSDRYGIQTLFAPNGSVLAAVPQYEVAANATLTNGQFNTSNGSLNSAQGWATEGNVAIEAGAATLNESATQQTRLNQVFIVGPQDRYLSFTLSPWPWTTQPLARTTLLRSPCLTRTPAHPCQPKPVI